MPVQNNTYNIQEIGLAKALVRKGHTCDVLFWTDKHEETIEIPVSGSGSVHVFYRHGKALLKNVVFTGCSDLFARYDILQPCEYNQLQAWILAKKQADKTVIYHGPYYSPFNRRYNLMCKIFDVLFLNRYIKLQTKFLVKSESAKEFLTAKGIRTKDIKVAGVGFDVQMLSGEQEECTEPLYIKLKENGGGIKLLYIGRFEARRNIPFILDVFKEVLAKHPDSHLYMIGTGAPDYMKAAFSYMEKIGVRSNIIWQEKMEQKYLSNVYKLTDFFLLPTEYEIFGMVLLEAMFYENVVLTTKNGGSSTLIENGINGIILESKEPAEWAKHIDKIYSDKIMMKKIKTNASRKTANHFTWDSLADGFIEQYRLKIKGE